MITFPDRRCDSPEDQPGDLQLRSGRSAHRCGPTWPRFSVQYDYDGAGNMTTTTPGTSSARRSSVRHLAGVRLAIGDRAARSDAVGRFLISGSDAGQQVLLIDGSAASTPGRRRPQRNAYMETLARRPIVVSGLIRLLPAKQIPEIFSALRSSVTHRVHLINDNYRRDRYV